MKSLSSYIQEKLVINSLQEKLVIKKSNQYYNYFPETREELKAIIVKRIKDEGNENLISEIKNKVIKANLFYGAVECAESVLSSGLLKLSLISVGAFVLALI